MKYKNFLLRAVNLLLILGVLWQYQQVALIRAAAVSQRKQEIAEVEAYNASVLQAQSAAQAEQSGYRDGIYEGSSYGFAVNKGENAELLEMFNAGLANLKESGKYDEILNTYIQE